MIDIKDDNKKMADLLRSGYTMLNLACPVCNNPLFRNKNKEIFCPICNKKVLIKKNENLPVHSIKIKKDVNKDKVNINLYSLEEIIEEKINWIAQKLKNEDQVNLIERHLKILIQLYDLLEKIKNNDASAGI